MKTDLCQDCKHYKPTVGLGTAVVDTYTVYRWLCNECSDNYKRDEELNLWVQKESN